MKDWHPLSAPHHAPRIVGLLWEVSEVLRMGRNVRTEAELEELASELDELLEHWMQHEDIGELSAALGLSGMGRGRRAKWRTRFEKSWIAMQVGHQIDSGLTEAQAKEKVAEDWDFPIEKVQRSYKTWRDEVFEYFLNKPDALRREEGTIDWTTLKR